MYSQNDYRDYLEHKWTWPGGNNSKEYNHWYYEAHKAKWKNRLKKANNAIGIGLKKELNEEEEKLRKWNKRAENEKEFINYVNDTAREKNELYKNTGNEGAKQAAIFATRYGGDLQRDFYETGSINTPAPKHLSEQANKVAKIKNTYEKSLLGKVDKYTEPGRKALSNAASYMNKLVSDLEEELMSN